MRCAQLPVPSADILKKMAKSSDPIVLTPQLKECIPVFSALSKMTDVVSTMRSSVMLHFEKMIDPLLQSGVALMRAGQAMEYGDLLKIQVWLVSAFQLWNLPQRIQVWTFADIRFASVD